MENRSENPFENEKPQLVHFEKSESHYEYCRMQMHDIERTHRRTFICNMVLCIVVCFLAVFQKYIACFDLLSSPLQLSDTKRAGAILAGGIFQIIIAMIVIVLGYLAWANFHTLNIILEAWYVVVTVVGIARLDYLSALIGVVGAVFYFFSIREMRHEQSLSEMEGYPDFQEKFDISKSDIVIQTLLAHQGERRTKSTLFTTDYSLRKKKKAPYFKDGASVTAPDQTEKEEGAAGSALAEELQKHISEVKDARQARTAIAALDAVAAEKKREKAGINLKDMTELIDAPAKETASESAAEPETSAAETAGSAYSAAETPAAEMPAENVQAERADAEAAAAAILAEAEAKAKAILAEAEEKAKAIAQTTESAPDEQQPEKSESKASAEAAPKPRPTQNRQGNANRKKKKKKR